MKTIIHFLRIKAPPEKVFDALTTERGVQGWWTRSATVTAGKGGLIDFRFLEGFNPDMRVTTLEPNRRVEWTCVGGHNNWKDNTFVFDIRASNGQTDLMFIQEYAQELSDEVYGEYNFNWGYYLGSLKQLCETGKGYPYSV